MIPYFIKSTICLLLLLAFYQLFLEKEKMHQFNRYYLLGSVLFSFLVPFYTIYIAASSHVLEVATLEQSVIEPVQTRIEVLTENPIQYTFVFMSLYVLVSVVFAFRFLRNLIKISQKIIKSSTVKYQKATLVLVTDTILPHTFLQYIFINKKEYEAGKIETELFTHELTHVTQKHSIDILLIELLQIVFWINPIFLFLKKAVKLNHEFLADNNVIASHNNISEYQSLLVNKAAWNNEFYLASNLNYSLTKKRLLMMKKQQSKTKILLKKLAILPLLASFVFLFANRVEAQEQLTITEDEKPANEFKDKTDEQLYKEYYFRNGKIITKDKNGKQVLKKFKDLTEIEKQKVIPPPPLIGKKKNSPTKTQLNNWKDNSKYAIWIDEKVVKNIVLNSYENTSFSSFFDSFVHKNARSKRFPQTHQVHLTTNAYFKKKNEDNIRDFEKYKKEQLLLNKSKSLNLPNGEKIKIIEDPKKENDVPKFITKARKTIKTSYHIKEKGATKKQLATYNALAKKYNKMPNGKRVYKLKDLQKLTSIYKIMTAEQKKNAEPFPEFLPPPPPPHKVSKTDVPPPPPPSMKPLDYVIKMAKKGETFYYKGKRISSDKAIDLLKKNKKLNIESKKNEIYISSKPTVHKGEQKVVPKLIATNNSTAKEVEFRFNNKIIKTLKNGNKNNKYFLDNKPVSQEELQKLSPNKITAVRIKKNADGTKSMYITRRKK